MLKRTWPLLLAILLVVGCGGGEEKAAAPAKPAIKLTPPPAPGSSRYEQPLTPTPPAAPYEELKPVGSKPGEGEEPGEQTSP